MADSAPRTSRSPVDAKTVPFQHETRLAVVMYGGVSLAIYINGVAQELLHLVRATAPDDPSSPDGPRFKEVTGVERVYRELGCRLGSRNALAREFDTTIRTRVVVDVLAGTSAGGLNGMFLAKALSNGGNMETLKRLWVEEGDLDTLLNDGRSRSGMPPGTRTTDPPESLLNCQRLYFKLLEALRAMNPENGTDPEEPQLVDELDLFITATDLTGLPLPLRIANGLIFEQRHKSVFHFLGATQYATGGAVNEFKSVNDAFLAFAGRATSSFPLAFEPMRLQDISLVPGSVPAGLDPSVDRWTTFFAEYLRSPEEAGKSEADQKADFLKRSFGDGGYLDNKPFSHAIDALKWRHADASVRRKLIYVEPSPDHPELDREVRPKPNAFENLLAASSTLPRQETIREDLERVLERNQRIEHVLRATRFVPDDVRDSWQKTGAPTAAASSDYAEIWLKDMVQRYGAAYGSYHRLKVAELTTELAEVVTRVAGLDERSDDLLAVRMMMSAWRQRQYDTNPPTPEEVRNRSARGLPETTWESENRLLLDYDLSYRLRRLVFMKEMALGLSAIEEKPAPEMGGLHPERPRFSSDRPLEILQGAGTPQAPMTDDDIEECRRNTLAVRTEARRIVRALSRIQVDLRVTGRNLRSRNPANPLAESLKELKVSREERQSILLPSRPSGRVARARVLLGWDTSMTPMDPEQARRIAQRPQILEKAAARAREVLSKAFVDAAARIAELLPPTSTPENSGAPATPGTPTAPDKTPEARAIAIVRRCLRYYYDRFEHYDLALFPMTYGTDVGELAQVEVVRVSPEDAVRMVRERDPRSRELRLHKLAGTRLGNFGAFLAPLWRRSDILWGRLDAAEILLDQLLPAASDVSEAEVRESIIARAQVAILADDLVPLGEELGRRVLVEAFLHTPTDCSDPIALTQMLDRLDPHLAPEPALARLLERNAVMKAHLDAFARERNLAAVTRYRLASRAVAIFGQILDGISGPKSRVANQLGKQLAFLGRAVWGFVELAVPGSIGELMFRNGIQLLYLLEVLLWAGGAFLNSKPAQEVGQQTLAATVGLHVLYALLRSHLKEKRFPKVAVLTSLGLVVAGLAVIGYFMFPAFLHRIAPYFKPMLACIGRNP